MLVEFQSFFFQVADLERILPFGLLVSNYMSCITNTC